MVGLNEQIMLRLAAQNNASQVAQQVDNDFQSMASSISSSISGLSSGMMNLNSVTDNMMQGLTGKSALDNIIGTSSKAETNNVLLGNMLEDSEKNFESFYETVDKTTDSSIVSMQELIPALNALNSATGATDKELNDITPNVANFGASVLAQTGSVERAQQAMMDLSKGYKGAFASLDQYGITEDALSRAGYNEGDGLEKYMDAVTKVVGSTDELMETNQGLDALIGKSFSRAGKKMGNEFLPVLKDIKRAFIELDDESGGAVAGSILAVSGGIQVMNQALWNVSTTVQGFKDLKEGLTAVKDIASEVTSAFKTATDSAETLNTAVQTAAPVVRPDKATEITDDLFKVQEITPEIEEAASHGSGFGYYGEDTLEELEKYAGTQKATEKEALSLLDEAKASNEAVNAAKLDYIADCEDMMGDVKVASKSLDVADDVGDLAKGTEAAVMAGAEIGAEAPAAAAASVAVEETAAATTTLSAAFTSMIVPALAISAVIAVMIPIAAALAAEALIFLKAIQMVFDALDFGGTDLSDDIDGIKQLAEGLLWVGAAMGALALVNVTTGIAAATSMFLGMTGPLEIAVDALGEASRLLSQFSGVKIDDSVPKNLQNISQSLTSVSSAMMALTGTNISVGFSNFVAWVFGFSSTTDALGQAKQDLIKASTAINELATGIEPLNEEDAAKIQNVCDSLASVGDAISALRSIRDGQNWDDIFGGLMEGLFGEGVDIQEALTAVKDDVAKAATALQEWNLPEIPEGIGDKVKKVSDTLTSLSDSFQVLRGIRDDTNWDDFVGGIFGGVDIQSALTNIKKELYYTANNLKGLEGMPQVADGLGEKIKTITDTVTSVSEASSNLTSVPDMGDYDPANLSTAVTNVQTAATELSKLNETTFNGDAASGVLGSINSTIETLKTTLSGASGFSEAAAGIGTQIVSGVQSSLSPLTSTVTGQVSQATSSAASTGWTGGAYIGQSTTGGFQSALQLAQVMTTEMGHVESAVQNGISAAKSAAQSGAKEVVSAFKSGINVGSPGDIARTMQQEMLYTKDFIVGSYGYLKQSAYDAASVIVDAFDPKLNNNYFGNVGALDTVTSKVPQSNAQTIIMYNNVTVDARNKTEKEARNLMTLALESMDNITNIDVDV